MSSKAKGDDSQSPKALKPLGRKELTKKIDEVNSRLHEIEKEVKSLTLKAPDKEFYAVQRSEDISRLNDAKLRRENQFKDKRIIDCELSEINQQVGAKEEVVRKLKSSLKHKSPEKVDDVIRKHNSQLQRMQMTANEERRLKQKISELEESKSRIQDFVEGEEEIKRLKEKQKNLRDKIAESYRIIKALKQEETAAKSMLEQHRADEDTEWTIYKENLTKRNHLHREKDRLFQERKNLKEQYRKVQPLRGDFHSKRDSLLGLQQVLVFNEQQTKTRDQGHAHTRTITEKKRPFEDEIMQCVVLLAYLERHESQAEPSADAKEVGAANEVESNDFRGGGKELVPDEGIYRGVKRKPSKRERRRKQHIGETAKKLEHQIGVMEQFYSLGLQPPATVADIPKAKRAVRERKKFLRDSQKATMDVMKMQRAKSNPYIASFGLENKDTAKSSETKGSSLFIEKDSSKDDLLANEVQSPLSSRKRHKSCPSLPGEMRLAELDSPYPSPSKEISASNSEYDLDLIGSIASSTTSMTDLKSNASEEKRKSLVVEDGLDFADARVESEFAKPSKGHHRVHFANDITQVTVDQETTPNGDLEKEGGPFGNFDTQSNGNFCSMDRLSNQMQVGDVKLAKEDQDVRNRVPLEEKSSKLLPHSEYENGISFSNPNTATRRRRINSFEDDDADESEDKNSMSDANELQFEMDDIPSRFHSGDSHLEAERNGDDALSDGLNGMADDFNNLQFQMNETDDNCASEQRVNDSFSTLHQRSSGSCSPRRT